MFNRKRLAVDYTHVEIREIAAKSTVWCTIRLPISDRTRHVGRFRAKSEQLKRVLGILPESQGQNLAQTVLNVLSSLDSGTLGMRTESRTSPPRWNTGLWSKINLPGRK